ncbi:MAG: polysaccharide biosynthesis tyrosine autokinase [Eubacteriales bacterium]|nr:polysaccharide biosynthesis tyrosine autokinase [Eubacteriales bacterium]
MSEYTTQKNMTESPDEAGKIDLISFLMDYMNTMKRLWWIPVVTAVLLAGLFFLRVRYNYNPVFTAEATVSVRMAGNANNNDTQNGNTASQLGKIFPYILTSGALSEIVAEDLGTNGVGGDISVNSIDGTNLLTIRVTASDGPRAYEILQSVIRKYPDVAQYVVGQTELEVIDDNGIPQDGGQLRVERGSMRRGAFIGLVLGLMILAVYMMTFRTIRSAEDLRSLVNAPYLGSLPFYRTKKRKRSAENVINILEENPAPGYVDAMRLLRTRVERRMEERETKTLMVTSSIPGEGKSTVASNLAISMARRGKKVILVDCDLRNPSQRAIFGEEGEFPGLEAVINGKCEIEDALGAVQDGSRELDLRVLYGKSKPSNRVEILGSSRMGELIRSLEGMCDILILDTPPSAMLVDAMMLVKHVDLALYVVMYDYARRQYILKGIQELHEIGIHIAGCVINGGKETKAKK